MNDNKGLEMYHGQAPKDVYADRKDKSTYLPTTSIKEIKDAYNEFMKELLLESQEAY